MTGAISSPQVSIPLDLDSVVPAINIDPFVDASDRAGVVTAWRDACERIGFVAISGRSLPTAELQQAFEAARTFFDRPLAFKEQSIPPGRANQRGYSPFATRRLGATLGQRTPPDLKESFYLGPLEDHRGAYAGIPQAQPVHAPNVLPVGDPVFADALVSAYRTFEELSATLLRICAVALELEEDWFADKMARHFSVMTCHHYPALTEPPLPGQLRAGAHTDFGALTILAPWGTLGGLEVQAADGRWAPVRVPAGSLVINLGDMMQRWTNDRWQSTLHRVANPPGISLAESRRQSIGFFVHPSYDATIRTITGRTDRDPKYPDITAGEHISSQIERSQKAA
jgi:isopenicillin N synthase-like dioxygenase